MYVLLSIILSVIRADHLSKSEKDEPRGGPSNQRGIEPELDGGCTFSYHAACVLPDYDPMLRHVGALSSFGGNYYEIGDAPFTSK